jgi:hypothetical protein
MTFFGFNGLEFNTFKGTWQAPLLVSTERDVSGASGKVFEGSKIRHVNSRSTLAHFSNSPSAFFQGTEYDCKNWAVCTTIFEPSRAVHDVCSSYEDYCVVVVADLKTPSNYSIHGNCNFVFLPVEEQKKLQNDSAFASSLAWNHFGRKNIGYLYAIANGAETVWDFDDDNQLIGDIDLRTFHVMNQTVKSILTVVPDARTVLNPYPALGSTTFAWPRGFPLDEIRTSNKTIQSSELFVKPIESNIAVIQALADVDPDVDAIYRLQREIPFFFNGLLEAPLFQVPSNTFVPFNAQATLWIIRKAFWGLYLPISVHGRVSDIWRAYIFQHIATHLDLSVAFSTSAWVEQQRNAHSYIADLDAEHDLYFKTGRLIEHLSSWKPRSETYDVDDIFLQLYISLYEHGYVELQDVTMSELWINELRRSGFLFPRAQALNNSTSSARDKPRVFRRNEVYMQNVTLLVRINHEFGAQLANTYLRTCYSHLRRYGIRSIIFHGKNMVEVRLVQGYGLKAHACEDKTGDGKGYFWYAALNECKRFLQKDDSAAGVLFAHDDIFLNLARLADGDTFPLTIPWFSHKFGINTNFLDSRAIAASPWTWFNKSVGVSAVLSAISNDTFNAEYGKTLFACDGNNETLGLPIGNGDVFYIPSEHIEWFAKASATFADHNIFLEIAVPIFATCFFNDTASLELHTDRAKPPVLEALSQHAAVHGVKLSDPKTREAVVRVLSECGQNL